MKLPRHQFLHLVAGAAAFAVIPAIIMAPINGAARAQTRLIKIVAPVPPGGSNDILSRLMADQIGRRQGLSIVVENRPGAGSVIGTEAVSRAAPDGNTLLMAASAILITPYLQKVSYDPLTSFEPICQLVSSPTVFVVNSTAPYRTFVDLLTAARAKPSELTMASIGPGTPYQLGFEVLKRVANVNLTYVPFSGSAPAINALLGQHVTSVFAGYANVAELIATGKVRALAVASRARIEPLPDVPTVIESGYNDFEVDQWFGLFAPAKTPKDTTSQLASWFTTAVQTPEVKPKLVAQGLFPVGMCGTDFASLIRNQYVEFGRIIREANIKAQ